MTLREGFKLKNNLNKDCILSKTIEEQKFNENLRRNNYLQLELESNVDRIKGFHTIIKIIKRIQFKYTPNTENLKQLWEQISDIMIENGFIDWSEKQCRNQFDYWAKFYVQVI